MTGTAGARRSAAAPARPARWGDHALRLAAALLLAAALVRPAAPAAAAPSVTLVYSTDGGASWSSAPTVARGGTLLARLYYANDTTGAIAGAQLATALPAGFALVAGSTRVCLNPSTTTPTSPNNTELACNTDAGQSGAIAEGAVWSGGSLTISPTAGLFGQASSDTSGVLAMGKTRYVNLHYCAYSNGVDAFSSVLANTGVTARHGGRPAGGARRVRGAGRPARPRAGRARRAPGSAGTGSPPLRRRAGG